MNDSNSEPLRITKTYIKHFHESGYFHLEVQDQYGWWWIYRSSHTTYLDEIEEIEAEEAQKGIINRKLYYPNEDEIIDGIDRSEEVWKVYSGEIYGEYGCTEIDPDVGARVYVMTNDWLEFYHDEIFYDYEKLKEFALKVKEKGIINLKFWNFHSTLDPEDSQSFMEEFEDKTIDTGEEHEWSSRDIYNSLGGEDGEMKYMHDGAWISPDGTITYDR